MNALPTPPRSTNLGPAVLAALLGQSLISTGTHLAAKSATTALPATTLLPLRMVLSALVYAVILSQLSERRWPPRALWGWLLGYGFLTGPMNQGLFLLGLQHSRATHASLLYALTPVGVYLLGVARGTEESRPRRWLGIALAFAGVLVLLLGRGLAEESALLFGDLLLLGAVVAWVFWTTDSRAFATEHGGLRTAGWTMLAGGVWALPMLPFTVDAATLSAAPGHVWLSLAYLVVLTSVVSYALWNFALARVESSRVAVFANVQPVLTSLAAWLVLAEPLGWSWAACTVLVIAGVRLATKG